MFQSHVHNLNCAGVEKDSWTEHQGELKTQKEWTWWYTGKNLGIITLLLPFYNKYLMEICWAQCTP